MGIMTGPAQVAQSRRLFVVFVIEPSSNRPVTSKIAAQSGTEPEPVPKAT
ncbi:hypothetical protein ACH495_19835 [Micromonospora sp. NPDC018662]